MELISGSKVYPETQPYAMAYAGHQFGNWAGQLGDGRAINLFEVLHNNQRWALQLKGAGKRHILEMLMVWQCCVPLFESICAVKRCFIWVFLQRVRCLW